MTKVTDKPKISVITITYNHENFIEEALDSIVTQEVGSKFELIIADDGSTDKTQKIIRRYAKKYPAIIKPILRKKNIGAAANFKDAILLAKGEYIALCEGDDYWTDSKKLQLQVDFLDSHPNYSLVFHPVKVVFENSDQPESIYPSEPYNTNNFTVNMLIQKNYIQTNSVMYRRASYLDLPTNVLPLDWYLHLYHAKQGKIGFIDKTMAVYRRHEHGVWWRNKKNALDFWKKNIVNQLGVYREIEKIYSDTPSKCRLLKRSKIDLLDYILSEIPVSDQHEVVSIIADNEKDTLLHYAQHLQVCVAENRHSISELQKHNEALETKKVELINKVDQLNDGIKSLQNAIKDIEKSKIFRLNKKLRKAKSVILKPITLHKNTKHRHVIAHKRAVARPLTRTSSGAVILHLYYHDMWPYFSGQLKFLIQEKGLDLFVSLVDNSDVNDIKKRILEDFPGVQFFVLPNRGRDVLPFLTITQTLNDNGYEYFLKLHSKKSPQRNDGNTWAREIFNDLIVQNENDFQHLKRVLTDQKTGIVGPTRCYIPLPTYYNDNHLEIRRIVENIYGRRQAIKLDSEKWNYGFFAGTMFWARLDAIKPVLDTKIRVMDFVEEQSQLDGTIAHALERVFCIVPELNNKFIYEIERGKTRRIAYKTTYTPRWSDHYREDT